MEDDFEGVSGEHREWFSCYWLKLKIELDGGADPLVDQIPGSGVVKPKRVIFYREYELILVEVEVVLVTGFQCYPIRIVAEETKPFESQVDI